MNYKKMFTSLATATILLTSITGTGLTVFTEAAFADTINAEVAYVYTLKGYADYVFSKMEISIKNMDATISTFSGAPHGSFSDSYASILIQGSRGQLRYTKDYVGTTSNTAKTEKASIEIGDYITVNHKESASRLTIQNETTQTPLAKDTTTIYMVTSTGLVAVTKEEKDKTTAANDKVYQDKARQEVNALFEGENPLNNTIKETTNQDKIDGAQRWIDIVVDAGKKASLQADLDKAQGLLNAKVAEEVNYAAAEKAIKELFVNDLPSSNVLKGNVNNNSLDVAKALFNKITDPAKKASLQVELDKAQALRTADILFGNEVKTKLNNLYKTDNSNEIKDTTDQKTIDALQLEIDKVVEVARKTEFQVLLDKAQALLDTKVAEEQKQVEEVARQMAAEKAVNELFKNDISASDEIKETTDQQSIDAVQEAINAVTDGVKKASLQKELDNAQALLDAKVAEEQKQAEEVARQVAAEKAINELFKNDISSSDEIKETTDQQSIDAVQEAINAVTDDVKKNSLQKELDKAQVLLDAKLAEEQKQAEEVARQVAVEKAINELFKNDTSASDEIKETTDQKSIDAVQEAINALTDDVKKASLKKELDKAQVLLDAKIAEEQKQAEEVARQVAAEKAVNELFKNDTSLSDEIKETTDQKMIDSVQALVNTVSDQTKKEALQAVVDQAKNLLAEKSNHALDLNEFQLKVDGNITGKLSDTIKFIRVSVNDVVYTGGTLKTDGTFTFYAKDKIKVSTDKVIVSAYNATGDLVVSKNLTVSQSAIGKGTVTPSTYQVGVDSNLIGTYTGDVSTIRVYVDDSEYKGGTLTKADGSFKFYLKDKVKNVNQVVTIKGFDVNGNILSTNTVTLKAQTAGVGQILPAPFVLGTDYYVTGTYKGDVRKIRVFVDGTEYSGGTISSNGTFKFYGRDKIKSKANEVKIIAYDANEVATEEKIIPVVSPEPGEGEILPNVYNIITDNSIKGTFTGDVAQMKLVVDDVEYTGGTFNSDKTFSFYARGKVTSTAQNILVRGYDVQGNLLSEKQLVVMTK